MREKLNKIDCVHEDTKRRVNVFLNKPPSLNTSTLRRYYLDFNYFLPQKQANSYKPHWFHTEAVAPTSRYQSNSQVIFSLLAGSKQTVCLLEN